MIDKKIFLSLVFVCVLNSHAHEGHGIPGALPPAPHGGVVQEAEHVGVDIHKHGKGEVELFFEVVYKDKQLSIYPLTLPADKPNMFVALSPKEFASVGLKTEIPRTKKVEKIAAKIEDDAIRAAFDPKNANRFIVHVSAEHQKETKVAKVQIERR